MWRSSGSALALVLVCAACGAEASPPGDQEWTANARGAIVQLRDDVLIASGIDPRLALRDDSSLYGALVVFTDFGGCRHMVAALGSVPPRFSRVDAELARSCTELQRAGALFTRAVKRSSVELLGAAIDVAQRALPTLDRAELALRGE